MTEPLPPEPYGDGSQRVSQDLAVVYVSEFEEDVHGLDG